MKKRRKKKKEKRNLLLLFLLLLVPFDNDIINDSKANKESNEDTNTATDRKLIVSLNSNIFVAGRNAAESGDLIRGASKFKASVFVESNTDKTVFEIIDGIEPNKVARDFVGRKEKATEKTPNFHE